MKLLAIETATDACSCAVSIDGAVSQRHVVEPRRHAELVLSMIEDLLLESDLHVSGLDAIAFGSGPGSFTGLRIAAGVTQGLAFGGDLPVAPIPTSLVLACGARRRSGARRVAVATDARMGEVYFAAYRDDGDRFRAAHPDALYAPADTPALEGSDWHAVGSAWAVHGDSLRPRYSTSVVSYAADALPRAADMFDEAARMLAAGETVSAERAQPVYLRQRVAEPSIRRAPGVDG